MNEKTTIIIPSCGVNFEGALKPCIESLLITTDLKAKNNLLLVMNGMKEKEKFESFIKPIIEAGEQIEYLWHDEPLGYVGAINTGLKHIFSQEEKPDYVMFLNDDVTMVAVGLIEEVKAKFTEDPQMGLVGAKSLPCPITGVDFPLGWCVLIKREVFEKIGYLDTAFGIGYGDDTDFAIRAIKAGYHVFSFVNGYDRKLKRSVGNFGATHLGEGTMHSGVFFSLDDWNRQTAKNRGILAHRYWQRVHVVVPVYKRYAKLRKALDGLRNQWYTNLLIHVVSDGDDEDVKALVQAYKSAWSRQEYAPEIEYTFVEHEGLYGSKPRISVLDSLESREDEWVCFHDSDNLANPDWILKLWQATFLKDVGGAWGKIRHVEQNADLPEIGFQERPVWKHVDSLNYLVRLDVAKKHAKAWQHKATGEKVGPVTAGLVTHDFDFANACFNEKPWEFVDEVLGSHGQEMNVLVMAVCYNEERLIPFFLRHYEKIAEKILVFDGGSTDRSVELLKAHPKVEVVSLPSDKLDDLQLMHLRNEAWKPYRHDYDWVIVCDIDEFLWHKNLKEKLEEFRRARVTVPTVTGYQIVAEGFPDNNPLTQIYDHFNEGYPDPEHLNKSMIFNPNCVDIRYEMGCHKANPIGTVNRSTESLYLLHYKYVGYEQFIERNKSAAQRISETNKKNNWGFHYARDAQMSFEDFRKIVQRGTPIVSDSPVVNPLLSRKDLKEQNAGVFREIIELNEYRVARKDFTGKNVIDVGANIGVFSLLANEYGAERIVAVEPNAPTLDILKRNVAGRGIMVIDKAAGKKDGEHVQMVMRPEFCATDGRVFSQSAPTGIETIGLDHLVSLVDDGKPILLKVDCEGAEYDLFYGASLKALGKVQTIVMEAHENIYRTEGQTGLIDKLRRYLTSLGFEEKYFHSVGEQVKMIRYDRVKPVDTDVTVVISAFNRPELLKGQVEAVKKQTIQPKEIIVWLTKSKHWVENMGGVFAGGDWVETKFDIPEGVTLVSTEKDLTLPARFAATLLAKTNYVLLLDDDVFPAEGYLEETLKVSNRENAVVSAYGMLYDKRGLNDAEATRYGDHGEKTNDPIEVDVGGHSWFGRKEWFSLFFREPALSPTEGDDLHFAYVLKKYSNVKLLVSAMPESDKSIWSNTNPDAGMGFRALHARKWDDVKKWTDPTKTSWGVEDKDYLEKNLKAFQARRQQMMERYRVEKKWEPLQVQKVVEGKKIEVTVDIATKNRYFSTLPVTLLSVMMQTYPIKKIIIVDDSDPQKDGKMRDLRQDPMYQYLFGMISKKGIDWEVVFGAHKGQHYSHQIVMDRSQTEFIWRLDDDEYAEPNVLEELVNQMNNGVGLVAGLVLDPNMSQQAPPNYFNNNRLADINTRENTQWLMQPKGKTIEVEHLYSSFLYRKVEGIKYCLELSPAAHREETLFSYEYVRQGWKALVTTSAVTWHFRNPEGGIRSNPNPEFWQGDDKIFQRKLQSWAVNMQGKKMIIVDAGIGDTIVFMQIIPELLKKWPNLVIGTYYFTLFKNHAVELVPTWTAKDIMGEKLAEMQNVYRYLWQESDKGRKLHILDAYKEMFIEEKI